jgi:hypothetical protein
MLKLINKMTLAAAFGVAGAGAAQSTGNIDEREKDRFDVVAAANPLRGVSAPAFHSSARFTRSMSGMRIVARFRSAKRWWLCRPHLITRQRKLDSHAAWLSSNHESYECKVTLAGPICQVSI